MDSIRKKVYEGLVTEEEYRTQATNFTINILKDYGFDCIKVLGSGSYGTVIELQHPLQKNLAGKIMLQEYVSESEIQLWPTLKHENILPVIQINHVRSAYTSVFFMPVHPVTVESLIDDPMFSVDINAFDRSISWLQGIAEGIKYLHDKKLCHLDLKVSNVLISESGKAVITDFGSLTFTEAATDNYVSPFIFRAPEALIEAGKKATVNGFKYDIFTFGLLALELFTKQSFSKALMGSNKAPNWANVVYSKIFDLLTKKKFKKLVTNTFLLSKIGSKTLKAMENFIHGCISLNPSHRPSIHQVLNHRLFGGSIMFKIRKSSVWIKQASEKKVNFLVSLFIAQAAALSFKSELAFNLQPEDHDLKKNDNGLYDKQGEGDQECVEVDCAASSKELKSKTFSRKNETAQQHYTRKSVFSNFCNRFLGMFRRPRKN